MCQVFISYSRDKSAGQALAEELEQHLKRQQIKCYRDINGIDFGDRWTHSLQQGIASSKVMLWIISTASDNSEWQEKEYHEANNHQLLIIPVLAEDIRIPMLLNNAQAAKLFGEEKTSGLQRLTQSLEKALGIDRIKPLIKDALAAKNNESYSQAIQKWQAVLEIEPEHERAKAAIEELQQLQQRQQHNKQLLMGLVQRIDEINPVFNDVAMALNQKGDHKHHAQISDYSDRFLQHTLSAEEFIKLCQAQFQQPASTQTTAQPTHYASFTQRLLRGEIVLFIGSELAQEYQLPAFAEEQLAEQLAVKAGLDNFKGGFSAIAEYYRLNKDFGEDSLLHELQQSLKQNHESIRLFKHLANIKEPLILVSATYDNALERQFDAVGKPYVELTSLTRQCDGHDVGHMVVRYSDRKSPEIYRPIEEEVSRFRWYEEGYSLIFKIRGAWGDEEHDYQREALTLAESDYFTFARYAERMIPAYLAKHFKRRGFLFVGFSPKSWEERLLVNALLARRNKAYANEPPYAAGVAHDAMEAAWWASQQVQSQPMDMCKLDEHLEEALL